MSSQKSILITQNQLFNFAGSEIATLELTEHFLSKGWAVTIMTNYYGGPMKACFETLNGVNIIEEPFLSEVSLKSFDIVWVHHNLLPRRLALEGSTKPGALIIFSHMSHQIGVEWPIYYEVENSLADIVLFNAEEVRDKYREDGVFFGDKEHVFPNPAPEVFWRVGEHNDTTRTKDVLVVSNHPPKEVIAALSELESDGYNTSYIGSDTLTTSSEYKRIKPEDLISAKIVITIGKTVQYCLATGTAVYCYDHFGGPGLITNTNFEKAKKHNFSGRGFGKKSEHVITSELRNIIDNKDTKTDVTKDAKKLFYLPKAVDEVLKKAEENKKLRRHNDSQVTKYQLEIFAKQLEYRSIIYKNSQQAQFKYKHSLENLDQMRSEVLSKKHENEVLKREIYNLENTIKHLRRPISTKLKDRLRNKMKGKR